MAIQVEQRVQLQRRRFTVAEYRRMAEAGILGEDERVELLDGEIVQMSPISPRHSWRVTRLANIFRQLAGRVIVIVQSPIHLGERLEPEPDLVLVRPETSERDHPGAADVLLVVEVAVSSLATDRDVKAPLYARAEIPEYWLADLTGDQVEIRREPTPHGYRLIRIGRRGERISPLCAPDLQIEVDEILGPLEDAET